MNIKDFIQNNPYRVLGVFTTDSSGVIASNSSKMKAFAAIGKPVYFPQDMTCVLGTNPDRSGANVAASMSAIGLPKDRLINGLFWFMNITETDAGALTALAQDGNPLEARKLWEEGEQNMSSLQNQLMCCLLKDPRSYSKAIQLAWNLYTSYGKELVTMLSNGFEVISSDELMSTFLCEIIKSTDGDCRWWDKAVDRHGDDTVSLLWADAKASHHISKLQSALNLAKTTEIHSTGDHLDIAMRLMRTAEPHLRGLKGIIKKHSVLLSRYSTIADAVCEEVLEREVSYYNRSLWEPTLKKRVLVLLRFCYRYAATIRFRERCKLNINITLGRKEDAPLFPNGTPDNLTSKGERRMRNALICGILEGLEENAGYGDFRYWSEFK